jgi:ABC-type antimicrobial peptide transport system permease subunit
MFRNYFRTTWRSLLRNKVYSGINIFGLAIGLAVAMLIGLWIHDELSYDKFNENYDQIAQVMRRSSFNGETRTRTSVPVPLEDKLVSNYPGQFAHVILTTPADDHVLSSGDKKIREKGRFMEPGAPDMLSLHMLAGKRTGLKDPSSILLSKSLAGVLFGEANPIDKVLKIDDKMPVRVAGVYDDVPFSSRFSDLMFVAPWQLYVSSNEWAQKAQGNWGINSYELYVQVAPHTSIEDASEKIKNIERDLMGPRASTLFLFPMSKWHLYSEWKNGVNTGGRIQFVWLFGIIGIFVLLLACINFMNLSTARSEKRAKEVGVRKAIGSLRSQLIGQFFCESLMAAWLAFLFALIIVQLALPLFNELADKRISISWTSPVFWLSGIGFVLFTALIAGSYPAFYLSAFKPDKILKGTFHAGRQASLPRKFLVVLQFTVSITLIIGTFVVYRQVRFAKDRPVGYNRDGLIAIRMTTADIHKHYEALRNDLIRSRSALDMAASQGPTTDIWDNRSGFNWPGKDPDLQADFATVAVTHEYGKTVDWKLVSGRDFSRAYATDLSSGIILNEAAAKFMGLKNPLISAISWGGEPLKVIGVVKDMVMTSPYEPVKPTVFYLNYENANFIIIRMNPLMSAHKALAHIASLFKKYAPSVPFEYKFVDEEYGRKFAAEARVGNLATVFAILATFISCLGLFGLVSFVAEQRTKEIGIRKVLGANVGSLFLLLSRDFLLLVCIALLTASPVAWLFMNKWLQGYTYRTQLSWWIFLVVGLAAVVIALLTVSFQAIKAALANPVKSLRTE